MKKSTVLFALLTLSLTAFAQDSGLWLLTARITQSRTMKKDTLIRTEAGNHLWEKERHVAGEAAPRIKLLLGDTKSFDEAGRLFYENFKSCPESTSSGVALMKSAFNVTVDSLKTKY